MRKINILKQTSVSFKRWSNKSYSVCSSLRKIITIGVLPIAYMATAGAQTNVNQDTLKINKTLELNEVVVSASRVPMISSDIARVVETVNKAEISLAAVSDIPTLLEFVPGVDVRQRGGNGVQADLSIRGGSYDQSVIMLNGINITDAQTGHHNLNLPVNISSLSQIEVLNGPGARVYGPNAFSGAVNFITQPTSTNSISANFSYGQHNFIDAGLSANIATEKSKSIISVTHKQSDGYIDNTDFATSNIFLFNTTNIGIGQLDIQAGYTDNAFGANSFYTAKYPNQYEQVKTTFASAKLKTFSKFNFTPSVYWRQNKDRFELFRDSAAAWYTSHNYHLGNTAGAALNSYYILENSKISFGLEYRLENIKSNVLGDTIDNPIKIKNEDGAFYTKSYQRNNYSAFVEYNYSYDRISLSTGVLSHTNSDYDKIKFFPGIDFSYKTEFGINAFASINKTMRMPTFTDLFYQGPTNVGNPDLEPEEATSYEIGIKLPKKLVYANASIFYRHGENMIDWIKTDVTDTKWQTLNLTEINSFGFQGSARLDFTNIYANPIISFTKIGYTYISMDKESSDYISKYVLDYLKHNVTFSTDIRIYQKLRTSWSVSYQDREGGYINTSDVEVPYDPFMLVNASVYYKANKWKAFIDVSNVLNSKYYDYGNVPSADAWGKVGIALTI